MVDVSNIIDLFTRKHVEPPEPADTEPWWPAFHEREVLDLVAHIEGLPWSDMNEDEFLEHIAAIKARVAQWPEPETE